MFRLRQHGTSVRREALAGLTTFSAMAYILVVNPGMLSATGMDPAALVAATALAAAAGSLLMALLTNYPVALAPGMGMNAFFTYTLCGQLGVPWQGALSMVFWSGALFLVLSLTPFRSEVVRAIPDALKTGIQGGIGLFILVIGLKNLGIVANPAPGWIALRFEPLASLHPGPLVLAGLGCVLAFLLLRRGVAGAILIAVAAVSAAGLFVTAGGEPVTPRPEALVSAPPSLAPLFLEIDWLYPFRHWSTLWVAMLTLVFVDLFDSVGTLVGVSRRAGLTTSEGELPRMPQALAADAAATCVGACLGTSTTTAYIESAAGVESGGRTGLTAVVVAVCFVLALFFHPLVAAVPAAAVAPALLAVGWIMLRGAFRLREEPWFLVVPAAAIVLMIPLGFQIADGIAWGCLLYTAIQCARGRWREVHWLLAVLSVLFVAMLAFG